MAREIFPCARMDVALPIPTDDALQVVITYCAKAVTSWGCLGLNTFFSVAFFDRRLSHGSAHEPEYILARSLSARVTNAKNGRDIVRTHPAIEHLKCNPMNEVIDLMILQSSRLRGTLLE